MAYAIRPRAKAESQPAKAATASASDALARLKEDHAVVEKLFERYEESKHDLSAAGRKDLAGRICAELALHARIEEEIFYPAVRSIEAWVDKLPDLLDEAEVEHSGATELIAQIQAMAPEDGLFDATVKVLGEYIRHHVKEEEEEMFPKVREAKDLDLEALGAELQVRSQELKGDPKLV